MILDERIAAMRRFRVSRRSRHMRIDQVAKRLLIARDSVRNFEWGQWEAVPASDLSRLIRQERFWAFENVRAEIMRAETSNVRRIMAAR